jgi:ABC-type arginine/histidine transport system permease subunit
MELITAIVADLVILAKPALFNIYFAAASIPIGFVLAIFVALGKGSRNRLISALSRGFIYAFRGSPFFIQLFAIYSLMLSLNLALWKPWGIDGWILHPLFLGPAILALNSTAYTAAILHGALSAVPRREIEAARAFGMSRPERFRAIVWPHVIRIAWPAYTNEVVFSFHATALIYFSLPVIGEQKDLMNKAAEMFRGDYNVFLHYSVAALYFLVISLVIFQLFGLVYRRLMRHLPGAVPLRFSFGRMVR